MTWGVVGLVAFFLSASLRDPGDRTFQIGGAMACAILILIYLWVEK